MKTQLPDKPSELITVALNDLRAIEKNPLYTVGMSDWHSSIHSRYDTTKRCEVCLAGAVMANTLELPIDSFVIDPIGEFGENVGFKLVAINDIRTGNIEDAKANCTMFNVDGVTDRKIPHYSDDRKGFFRQLRRLANDYKKLGH